MTGDEFMWLYKVLICFDLVLADRTAIFAAPECVERFKGSLSELLTVWSKKDSTNEWSIVCKTVLYQMVHSSFLCTFTDRFSVLTHHDSVSGLR